MSRRRQRFLQMMILPLKAVIHHMLRIKVCYRTNLSTEKTLFKKYLRKRRSRNKYSSKTSVNEAYVFR
jgi:hypothetical protein